jgi:hypothetical protein
MTIQFNCPHCGAIIAFNEKHSGKRARCLTCGQLFVIPFKDEKKPKKIKPEKDKPGVPLPGFYRAAFIDNWKLFTKSENFTGLVFIAAAVLIKFFTARLNFTVTLSANRSIDIPVPLGYILHIAAWGFLFWYYMEIIYATAFEIEKLPKVSMGGIYGFIWHIIKSIYTFTIALIVVELPFLIVAIILKIKGDELIVLLLCGLFFFPMAILTVAIGRDLTMLRPDYFVLPIFRAFIPYLAMSVLLGIAGFLQYQAKQYYKQEPLIVAEYLLLNFVAQILILMSMRAIAFFYKHYTCCLPW